MASVTAGSQRTALNGVLSVLAYSACSVSMILVNKMLVGSFDFRFDSTLLLVQSVVSIAFLYGARQLGLLDFKLPTVEIARQWLPINLFFVAMLYTSFRSLKLLTVPTVTVFKNLTNLGIVFGAWQWFGEPASLGVLASLLLIVIGAVLSGIYDLMFSWTGYAWMLANCVSTAGYVLKMRGATQLKLTEWDKAFVNNLLTIPFSFLLAVVRGEFPASIQTPLWSEPAFVSSMVFSGAVGTLLGLSSLWCIAMTSATTYSTVGALNKIPLVLIGIVIFSEPVTWQSSVFIAFGIAGGMMYTFVKDRERATGSAVASSSSPSSTTSTSSSSSSSSSLTLLSSSSSSSPVSSSSSSSSASSSTFTLAGAAALLTSTPVASPSPKSASVATGVSIAPGAKALQIPDEDGKWED